MKKLLLLGDSILKGVFMDKDTGKYHLFKGRNLPELEERGVEVKNACKMGACIDYCEKTLEAKADFIDEDTTVLLSFGGNDCDYTWSQISADPEGLHLPNTGQEQFLTVYERCIRKAGAMAGKVQIMNLFPIKCTSYFAFISKNLDPSAILRWLGDVETLNRTHEYYNWLVTKLAARCSVPLIDIRNPFLIRRNCGQYVCADGIHPTEEGHRLIRQMILSSI